MVEHSARRRARGGTASPPARAQEKTARSSSGNVDDDAQRTYAQQQRPHLSQHMRRRLHALDSLPHDVGVCGTKGGKGQASQNDRTQRVRARAAGSHLVGGSTAHLAECAALRAWHPPTCVAQQRPQPSSWGFCTSSGSHRFTGARGVASLAP
jgi:hypothetical protein